MLKYLRIAVTAVSLSACVLLVALWARSAYKPHAFFYSSGNRHMIVWSCHGKLFVNIRVEKGVFLVYSEREPNEVARDIYRGFMEYQLEVARESGVCPIPDTNSFGFEWSNWKHFVMPYWFLVALSAALAATPWLRPRFSLHTLLIATALVAMLLGVIVAARV